MMDEAGKKIKQLEEEQKKKERENEEFIRHYNEASRLAESFSRLEQAVKRAQELNKQEGDAQKRADLKKIDAAIALNGDREALVTLYMNRKTKENDLARAEKEQKEARVGWENAEKQFEQLERERPQQHGTD